MSVRHIRKFDHGRSTPQEYHRRYAFPLHAICECCGTAKPVVRAIALVEAKEAAKRGLIPVSDGSPETEQFIASCLVQLRGSDGRPEAFFRVKCAYACSQCRPTLERVLARLPSWAVVDIQEGPDPRNRTVVGYTGANHG